MTTPDSFFNIKPDLKPGSINRDGNRDSSYAPERPENAPDSSKNFREILENKEQAKGQPNTLRPESKVAPRLGKEQLIAPEEEPRADPFIELAELKDPGVAPSIFDLSKGKAHDQMAQEQLPTEIAGGLEEEVFTLTNKLTPTIDPLTGQPIVEKPRMKNMIGDMQPEQIQETPLTAIPGQAVIPEKVVVNDQAFTSKVAAYFEPLLNKLFGEKLKMKDTLMNRSAMASAEDAAGQQQVNFFAQTAPTVDTSNQIDVDVQPPMTPHEIDHLVRQIVDSITVTKTSTQTDTTITLKYPPILDGAVLTVTSFKAHPNEIQVTFQNLTQEAKMLLDNLGNRSALETALDQKGYTMHMITTTTSIENLNFNDSSSLSRQKREGKGDQSGMFDGQGRQKGNRDEA